MSKRRTETSINMFGGSWTEEKLANLCAYATEYLKILNKYPRLKTIYFDGFAGPGYRLPPSTPELPLVFEPDYQEEDYQVFAGSPKRILELGRSFDYYYFIDSNDENVRELEKLKLDYPDKNITARHANCSDEVRKLAKALHTDSRLRALVFIDPYGLHIQWDDIATLEGTSVDLWILIPSGFTTDLSVHRDGTIRSIDKLCAFYGVSESDLRDEFYRSENRIDMFDHNDHRVIKNVNVPELAAKLYIRKLSSIFSCVVDEPLQLWNSNRVLFHLAFASNNETAKRIAEHLVKKNNASH